MIFIIRYEKVSSTYILLEDYKGFLKYKIPGFLNNYGSVDNDGHIFIKNGFSWDGSSYAIDSEKCLIPSLIHDFSCYSIEAIRADKRAWRAARKSIDKEYRDNCLNAGMGKLQSYNRYFFIRIFGNLKYLTI